MEEMNNKWNDVKEGHLPMVGKAVLIANSNIRKIGHARRVSTGGWRVIASNDFVGEHQVTHWMYLPEPPTM